MKIPKCDLLSRVQTYFVRWLPWQEHLPVLRSLWFREPSGWSELRILLVGFRKRTAACYSGLPYFQPLWCSLCHKSVLFPARNHMKHVVFLLKTMLLTLSEVTFNVSVFPALPVTEYWHTVLWENVPPLGTVNSVDCLVNCNVVGPQRFCCATTSLTNRIVLLGDTTYY